MVDKKQGVYTVSSQKLTIEYVILSKIKEKEGKELYAGV
jgi:hypothetical protein